MSIIQEYDVTELQPNTLYRYEEWFASSVKTAVYESTVWYLAEHYFFFSFSFTFFCSTTSISIITIIFCMCLLFHVA